MGRIIKRWHQRFGDQSAPVQMPAQAKFVVLTHEQAAHRLKEKIIDMITLTTGRDGFPAEHSDDIRVHAPLNGDVLYGKMASFRLPNETPVALVAIPQWTEENFPQGQAVHLYFIDPVGPVGEQHYQWNYDGNFPSYFRDLEIIVTQQQQAHHDYCKRKYQSSDARDESTADEATLRAQDLLRKSTALRDRLLTAATVLGIDVIQPKPVAHSYAGPAPAPAVAA